MDVKKVPGYRKGSTYFTCDADSGFFYRIKIKKSNIIYLVCVEANCRAKAKCSDTLFLNVGDHHNHLPDMNKEESLLLKNHMINKATNSSQDLKSIYVEESAG